MAQGIAIAVVFLSFTLLTGEGGMIWLCQISFAGVGALTTAQVASVYHRPVLLGIVVGGLLAAAGGFVIGALTIRMGNLYVALATLTFGLLLSQIVFQADRFVQFGVGVDVPRPAFLASDVNLSYFMLAVFVVIGTAIVAIRRSTTGLALAALRSSEIGARATGVNVFPMKIGISTLAAGIAGVGGGLYALHAGVALPSSFEAIIGLVWFAVLATNGTRSNNAALAGGLFFVFLPEIFASYLPVAWGPLPTLLFGAGAILLARNPEGVIVMNGRQLTALGRRLRGSTPARGGDHPVPPPDDAAAPEVLMTEPADLR